MGKGSNRRQGANDTAYKLNAQRTGFPPESPTFRLKLPEQAIPSAQTAPEGDCQPITLSTPNEPASQRPSR